MRLRKRHGWTAVLVVLFALPVVKPEGFPGLQGWGDSVLSWPARSDVANPHAWLVSTGGDSDDDDPRLAALQQMYLSEREVWATEREGYVKRIEQIEAYQASALDRLPRAVFAQILRARDSSPRRRSILINRGTSDGVGEGLAVASGKVFLGTVQRAQPRSARVKLITDPEARTEVAVRLDGDQRAVAFLWGGADPERLALRFARPVAAASRPIRVGDRVVTSNADERVPAGLLVGWVVEVEDPEGDGVPDVRVRPLLDLDSSTTVTVLLPGA